MSPGTELRRIAEVRCALADGTAEARRLAARVSRPELARRLGVHPASIGRWEHGRRAPHGDLAVRYWGVLQELARATAGHR